MKRKSSVIWMVGILAMLVLVGCKGSSGSDAGPTLSSAKAITAYTIVSPAASGVIDETAKTIAVTVPYGTTVTALVATFATTGASVTVGATAQASGTTANDFTGSVAYVVIAEDGTTATYTVTVTAGAAAALSSAKAITAYTIVSPAASGVIDETAKTIAVTVPYGTTVTALVATFATTGASVMVGATAQTSGTTANDFTGSVAYVVIAEDGTTATYTVTVTVAPNSIKLPATGLTTCYDATGGVIACTGTGQDGDLRKGAAWPSPRFTDNGNGTVTDNLTGLIWLKNADCFGVRTWTESLADTLGLASGTCGLTDSSGAGEWRLPNRKELGSMTDYRNVNPASPTGAPFTGVASGYYWTSTSLAAGESYAWFVNMDDGKELFIVKTDTCRVWPVRGAGGGTVFLPATGQTKCYDADGAEIVPCTGSGQDGALQKGVAWPSTRFTDNANGTMTDNLTGLIWLKDANCFNKLAWTQALSSANSLAAGACGLTDGSAAGDWRLPNVLEYESLGNAQEANVPTWLGTQGFSNVQTTWYWSSTTNANYNNYAWSVTMQGELGYGMKSTTGYFWPVRGGF